MPQTRLGKLSLGLIIAMPVLFVAGSLLSNNLYQSIPAGNTIMEDIENRPALSLAMLAGIISGVLSFFIGFLAILREKEQAPFVYGAIIAGFVLILFLWGEFLFPH